MAIFEPNPQAWTVASVPRGVAVEVIDRGTATAERLLVHGIRPGARIIVEGNAPFGGPCIVRVGRSRVAIDRRLAASIHVRLAADPSIRTAP